MNRNDVISSILGRLGLSHEQSIKAREKIIGISQKPLTIGVFGQTGVGKSSLINALFGTRFKTDDIKPCTKEPESHTQVLNDGRKVTFWDLPGLGESAQEDRRYLAMYREIGGSADIIIWAFQADTRSVALDTKALDLLLADLPDAARVALLSRIVVVVTKADLLFPEPWVLARDGESCVFATTKRTEEMLQYKARYFQGELLGRNTVLIDVKAWEKRQVPQDFLAAAQSTQSVATVTRRGLLTTEEYNRLVTEYPEQTELLGAMWESSSPQCCSARFRYRLNELLLAIVEKADPEAVLRMSAQLIGGRRLQWIEARKMVNLMVFDQVLQRRVFDLSQEL